VTNREAGINVVREMMGDQAADKLSASADSNTFGAPIAAYAIDQVFADIWTRPGLDRRSRSLVSMSVMIAMRQPASGSGSIFIRETPTPQMCPAFIST
jgi:4-carboxymuconolactone decarboxylase